MLESPKRLGEHKRGTGLVVPVLCLGLSVVAVVPFFLMGKSETSSNGFRLRMPVTHDMILHFDQMKSFHAGLSSGEVIPSMGGRHKPRFRRAHHKLLPAGCLLFDVSFICDSRRLDGCAVDRASSDDGGSRGAIYVYARRLMSRPAAIAAMVAYIFLPYHLVDQYQRGAMAELLGFVFMPLMLLFGERLLLDRSSFSKDEGRRSRRIFQVADQLGWIA